MASVRLPPPGSVSGGGQLGQAGVQGAEDGAPGVVLGVDDAVARVGPLTGEPERPAGIAVEGDLEVVDQQLAHHARAIFDDGVHRRRVGGVGAGGVDVGAQQVAVHLVEDDAPLRPQAVAGLQLPGAGDQGDVEPGARRLQRVDRTRQAGADHQAVGAGGGHRRPRKSSPRSGRRAAAVMALVEITWAPAAA